MSIAAIIGGFFCGYMLCMPYQSWHTLRGHIEPYPPPHQPKKPQKPGVSAKMYGIIHDDKKAYNV